MLPARGTAAQRNGFNRCRCGRVFGQLSGPQDRMQRTKLEIPYGHAFDSHGLCRPKALCASPARPSHEANAPILTPHIPAMIAAAMMALIATKAPKILAAMEYLASDMP